MDVVGYAHDHKMPEATFSYNLNTIAYPWKVLLRNYRDK